MARIRTIKPEFYVNEELSSLPAETHLFAGALLNQADDEGYFNAHPGLLKAAIFPLRECSVSVHDMLIQLLKIGFIRLGKSPDGKSWGHVVNFVDHQRINRPTSSKIKNLQISWGDSLRTHTQLTEDSQGKGKEGREGKEAKPPLDSIENLPAIVLAGKIAEQLGLTEPSMRPGMAASIDFALKHEGCLTKDAAVNFVIQKAREAIGRGEQINRFWFSDQKWKSAKGASGKTSQYQDAAELRRQREERRKAEDNVQP